MIREILRDLWANMSKQEIIVAGNPYWLIRFKFGNRGNDMDVVTFDDDGADSKPLDHITPAQYADPTKLANIQDVNTNGYVIRSVNRACLGLSPLNFMSTLFPFKGDEQLGAMGTNSLRTFKLPRRYSADRLGGSANRFGGLAETAARPKETSTTGVSNDLVEESERVDDDLKDLRDPRDVGYHIIPNDGSGLLCGIFALRDSIEHQIPATDIPTGRGPTDEELHYDALHGPAAQVLNWILPDEVHTQNFRPDHLASILERWGRRAGMARPLQLGIILRNAPRLLMPIDLPQGSPEPRRIWIEHEGDPYGKGGHYSGIALGQPDKTRWNRATSNVDRARMGLKAKLKKRALENEYRQARLAMDEEDLSDPESVGTKTKRLGEEKKREEEKQRATAAVAKKFEDLKVLELRAELKAEGLKGYSHLRKEGLVDALVKHEMKKQARGKPLAADDSEDEARSSEDGSEDGELASDYLESEGEDEDDDEDRPNDKPSRRGKETAETVRLLHAFQLQKKQKEEEALLGKRSASTPLEDFQSKEGEKKKLNKLEKRS